MFQSACSLLTYLPPLRGEQNTTLASRSWVEAHGLFNHLWRGLASFHSKPLITFMTMGDMKTPDFDDLLAAFDIPDMVDPKAAIESGHDDHESHLKQNAHGDDDSHTPSSSDVGVSVIVKNVRNMDSSEGGEKDGHNPTGNGLHNGFLTASSLDSYGKDGGAKPSKGDAPASEAALKDAAFSQFSPISSAEEFDDDEKIEVDDPPDKEDARPGFRSNVLPGSAPQQDYDKGKPPGGENSSKTGSSAAGSTEKNKVKRETEPNSINLSVYEPFKVRKAEDKLKENSEKVLESRVLDGKLGSEKHDSGLAGVAPSKAKSSSKLSSCIAAIAALSARKAASDSCKEPVAHSGESSPLPKEVNESPKATDKSPESKPHRRTKKPSQKPPDSPEASQARTAARGSTPAIPKVRIKTIKTSSGRTPRPAEQPSASRAVTFRGQARAMATGPPCAAPVATASLPMCRFKTRQDLANNTTVKATFNLLPTVQSARSAGNNQCSRSQPPKKVSRVQWVSLQSSVVEAFNKVLSIYIPNLSPPANADHVTTLGYTNTDVVAHRSNVQPFTKNLVFYNKCSLLSHARGHKEKGVVMQCSHLILKPVPADQMIVSPSSNTSAPSSTLQSPGGAGTHTVTKIQSGITGTVISAPSSTPVTPAMPLDEDPSKLCRHSLKCLECNEVFQDETSLATHFQHAADTSGQKTCTICQMLLPNQCSYASHQRIHQHKSPYTCPECGAICRSVHFQTHVTKNCLHYTRRVGFRCVHCNVVYSDVAALKSHIQGSHCEVFYKCSICPMAFKSAPSTHSHAYTQHPGIKIGEPKIIYKCSMCDTVFTLQTLLYRHFDQHTENQKVSVFKCPDCSLLYAQKQLMMDHIKSMHGTLKSIEGPPNLGINLPLSIKPATQNSANLNKEDTKSMNGKEKLEKKSPSPVKKSVDSKKVASPGWTCWECDRLFTQRDVYIFHVRKEHGKQMKKHPCRQCDKSFSSSHSLCRHNRIKHKGIRKVYTCSHCPDSRRTFTKRLMLEKHIQLMHGIKDPDLKEMTDITNEEEVEIKDDAKVPSPKRKLEEPVLEFRPPRGAITQPLKKLKINVFKVHKCAVCGFTTENLLQFHEHIPQHKSDGSSYQCRECGLCYTSHVSLSRHLFIVHKLKEPQPVSKQNGAGEDSQQENKPSPEDESPDGAVSDRKCKVCAKTFETEAALNTHMRTHGMAFIKSKRMSSAEK
uniref:Zinc finger protein 532 n=1 Tax=Microcebus murinus TaxID=30608 RepID=A0A8C6EGX8_MICMU